MTERLMARFRRFAEQEARGHSPLYEAITLGVAGDPRIVEILSRLPEAKQQPNLLLGAFRMVCGTPADWPDFRTRFMARTADIVSEMNARQTQTNEPGRCAVLLPLLARLHQPLALVEVGASAGLCLLPDRYAYTFNGKLLGRAGATPVFACKVSAGTPVPAQLPEIAWRAGLDLNPVNPRDPSQMSWLEALVWPDQPDRLDRLRAAVAVARNNPVRVMQGDLLTNLPAVLDQAPRGPTVAVFHSATLAYVRDPAQRTEFARTVFDAGAVWISHEVPGTFPDIAERVAKAGPPGAFLLSVNGQPVAWTDPHGAWIEWLAP